jgi:hypothetical protein
VHQPLAKTWAAFQDPEVVVDRRKVDAWRVTPNVEEGFDVSFRVHNTVNYILTVDFDITWRQSAIQGDRTAPEVVAVRFQKTYGTSFIELLSGSVIAREVGAESRSSRWSSTSSRRPKRMQPRAISAISISPSSSAPTAALSPPTTETRANDASLNAWPDALASVPRAFREEAGSASMRSRGHEKN